MEVREALGNFVAAVVADLVWEAGPAGEPWAIMAPMKRAMPRIAVREGRCMAVLSVGMGQMAQEEDGAGGFVADEKEEGVVGASIVVV